MGLFSEHHLSAGATPYRPISASAAADAFSQQVRCYSLGLVFLLIVFLATVSCLLVHFSATYDAPGIKNGARPSSRLYTQRQTNEGIPAQENTLRYDDYGDPERW